MFREMSWLVNQAAGHEEGSLMASYQVTFDGSGTFGQHSAISYGGAVASIKQWAAFAEDWEAVLASQGLGHFKMAEAMTWYGPFAQKYSDWGTDREQRREALLNELADLAVRYKCRATGMRIDPRVITQDQTVAAKKEELFSGALYTFLESIPRTERVTLLCDDELDLEPRVRALVKALRKMHGDKVAPVVAVCFGDDRVFPALQLADMVAWLFRELGERIIATNGHPGELNPVLSKLAWATELSAHQAASGQLLSGLRQYAEPATDDMELALASDPAWKKNDDGTWSSSAEPEK